MVESPERDGVINRLKIEDAALARGGRRLFEGVNLDLVGGEACTLTGANGSGKTSLLRAVAGLAALEAGRISFGDADLGEARGRGLHLVGHADGLKGARTVREELDFWTLWTGGTSAGAARAAEALNLAPLMDLEVRRLSAGQRRRLALSRLVAAPRPLWLLDEPFSPLDTNWRGRFAELMAEHLYGGGLILAAVHDPLPLAARTLELTP